MGVVYDARDDEWNSEIVDDGVFQSSSGPELHTMSTVPLPPFGLPSISHRVPVHPSHEALSQCPERDKVSVMKKYEKVPREEKCYVRMKLDLLLTLTLTLLKPQPRVREVLLSLNDNVAAIRKENLVLTDVEILALEGSVVKVISIANVF